MTQVIADRVKDTTTTTGTGNITLSGTAPTGYRTFYSVMPEANANCYYCIAGGAEWEVGYGNLSAPTTLVRARVIASSNNNALVNFSAGTKDVFQTIPATIVQNRGMTWATANGYAIN
jgi:hypothetical protein